LQQSANTPAQFERVTQEARQIFLEKARQYGTSWQVFRLPAVTDQLFIKARRIRSLQETGTNKVGESQREEFLGILNYTVIALILMDRYSEGADPFQLTELQEAELAEHYDAKITEAYALLEQKNHDYGEAWREMRITSITDMILVKLFRIKQMEDQPASAQRQEAIRSNYLDILNYAVFALILGPVT
jgi:hypothetical protein